jgi:hypothetical protein
MAKNFILHTIPTKLPPAKLYLDDITEIWQILTESCDEPRTSVIVGKAQCDSLKDLPDMGGRSTHLLMEISSPGKHHTLAITPSATTIHIHETGDQVMAWSKYVKVDAIFQKRKLRLKSLVRAAGPWMVAVLWLLSVAAAKFVPVPRHLTIYQWVNLVTTVVLACVVVYYFISSHSIVYLRHPHRVPVWRWLEDHKQELIVGFAGVLVGTLAARTLMKGVEAALHGTQLVWRW